MKNKRKPPEIERQINGLYKMKTTLPKHSIFGDENWAKIDAQILILKGERKPDDFYCDETLEEYRDGDNDIYFDACRAEDWLDGSSNDDLFE